MRALVFRGPGDIGVEHRPDPVPGPGEVLLRITATGICGSDLHGYTGENGRRHPGQVMGHETVAQVVTSGHSVPDELALAPGQTVTVNPVIGCTTCAACAAGEPHRCDGRRIIGVDPALVSSFAELMTVPAANVVVLPETMPADHGALVEPLSVGYHAAVRGQVTAADAVLVIGGGPIGQAAALAARRLGAGDLVVSEPSASRRGLLERLGLPTIDPRATRVADAVRGILGRPASAVLDAVGASATLSDALEASTPGSRVVLVGMQAPEVTLAAYALSTQERTLVGSFCYSVAEFRDTAAWVASGPPGLEHLIDGRVGLADAPEAFAGLAAGTLDASKVLVYPAGPPNDPASGDLGRKADRA